MSITIAGVFAKAWRREQFGLAGRLVRVNYLMLVGLAVVVIDGTIVPPAAGSSSLRCSAAGMASVRLESRWR